MTKIAIVGSYPPNYGGISIHVQRLHRLMAAGSDTKVYDLYSVGGEADEPGVERIYGNKIQRVLGCRSGLKAQGADLEHFHVSAMRKFLWSTPALLTGRKGAKRVLTIHGGAFPEVVAAFSGWEKRLFRWMLGRFDHFVCVSEKQRQVLDDWQVPAAQISVINAYLPPVHSAPSGDFDELQAVKDAGQPLLICAAQYLEHYGLEELTQAMAIIESTTELKPRLAVVSYAEVDESYRARCLSLRESLTPFFEFQNLDPGKIAELMALGDVFIRPTWWDGDAISVREAAFFGNRLVATDVTTRPEGTALCAAKDAESLAQTLIRCLQEPEHGVVDFDHRKSLNELAAAYRGLGLAVAAG